MSLSIIQQFNSSRDASTPLVGVQTPDIDSTVKLLSANLEEKAVPIILWDCVRGMTAVNKPQGEALVKALKNTKGPDGEELDFTDPLTMLRQARSFGEGGILFMANLGRLWDNVQLAQAIWNLRDTFKSNQRTLVVLGPTLKLPAELINDFLILNEPLPNDEQFEKMTLDTYKAAQANCPEIKSPDKKTIARCVDALCGLAAFPAEQVLAMSIKKAGMDIPALWERKRQQVEQTPGLKIYRGTQTFSGIGGCANIKEFYLRIRDGKEPPRAIVFQDEIEKQLAGFEGDMSGTTQELLSQQLVYMQDNNSTGILEIGHPGVCKTDIVKAAANEFGIPLIQLDLGQAKGSLVGESNQNMTMILKVVEAVSQGRALWAATCNNIKNIPVELRRRYSFGTFVFDLPRPSVRNEIWNIYIQKWDLNPKDKRPNDSGWTGSEIKNCCLLSYRLGISLEEASKYIVPISTSAKEKIVELRRDANGRYISADDPGVYQAPPEDQIDVNEPELVAVAVMKTGGRKINVPDGGNGGKKGSVN